MNSSFKNFPYRAEELSAYIFCIDTFIINLKSYEIIRYVAEEPERFRKWLVHHGIRDVKESIGSMVYNFYFEDKID